MGRQQDDRVTFYWWTLATISSGCQHQTRTEKVEILFENQIQIYFWQKIKHFPLSTFKIIFIFLNTLLTAKFEKISG